MIENAIKDVISKKLEEGLIEKLVAENLEKGINKALEDLFGSFGAATKTIEEKIKEVMLPQLSAFDYSKYIVKLDEVLKEILQNTTLDNVKILSNFKDLMIPNDTPKEITVSELFDKYCKFVAKNVDCTGLEVGYDDGPTYECVDVSFEFIEEERPSWSSFDHARIVFECEKDKDMNFEIRISRYQDKNAWDIDFKTKPDIHSLRHLGDFEIYLLKLVQNYSKIKVDEECGNEEVQPENEPEASCSTGLRNRV